MNRRKKILLASSFILVTLIILVLIINFEKNYSIKYKKDGINIKETYDKELKYYYFQVTYKDKKYELGIQNKFLHKKKLINKVSFLENEENICLYLISEYIDTYPICYKSKNPVVYSLMEDNFKDLYKFNKITYSKENFNSIKVNTFLYKNLAVWNHNGFSFLNDKKSKDLNLLKNESYYDESSFKIDKYLLLPNYDEEYSFKRFYVIDLKKGKVSKWDMDTELSYNFYYLGELNKKGYIIDKKSNIEYEIIPSKKRIVSISENQVGKVYDNGWTEISMAKLIGNNFIFEKNKPLNYEFKNNNIYLKYYKGRINYLVTQEKVDKLVSQDETGVYYLVKDKLYYYSPYFGNVEMIQYSEFEFNDFTSVYIY